MKILTWNINGLRAVRKDESLKSLFDFLDADILCFQETKITRDMLKEETAIIEGYNSYFSFSKGRSGYSGVATFCRDCFTPLKAENRIDLDEDNQNGNYGHLTNEEIEALNAEGRMLLTEHVDRDGNHVVIMNLYCPRAHLDNKERTKFKLQFYNLIQQKCKSLLAENKEVIVLGDFNVSHKLIDHCDPDDPEIFDSNPSRQWANTFILDNKELQDNLSTSFLDSFRYFHPHQESAFTCWSTMTGARQTNYGTRIDYIFSSVNFFKKAFTDCVIRPDIEGSDHCPVVATLKMSFKSSGKPPALCTKYMPEFSGKQQKLKAFFQKKVQKDATIEDQQKSTYKTNVKASEKIPEKRTASKFAGSQAKRLKTTTNSSQGSILQFVSKPKTKSKIEDTQQELKPEKYKEQEDNIEEQSLKNQEHVASDSSPTTHSSQNELQLGYSEENSAAVVAQWKNLLKGPPPAPLCSGHNEPSVLRTVKNKGPNHGKQFYCCARPQGHSTNKEARCKFFKWINKK